MQEDILLSHSGKQHSYKVAVSLQSLKRLRVFLTSFYYDPTRFPDKIFSKIKRLHIFLKRRNEEGLTRKVRRFPLFEIPETLLRTVRFNHRVVQGCVFLRDLLFDYFVAFTQLKECKIFWGFQGSCLKCLRISNKKGFVSFLEMSTGHVLTALKILSEEKRRNPQWADSISNLCFPDWYLKRLKSEPFKADFCIVASNFTRRTLEDAGVSKDKILLLPLGVDLEKFNFQERPKRGYLQLLFVGGVGQRKGIKYLLDAVKMINSVNVRLKIVGPIYGSGRALKEYSGYYEYLGPKAQDEIVGIMHQSDCLILPSLFEGFGLVIPEAMATGIPVITTHNSAGPDIIREDIDGFVVNPCDSHSIAEKIDFMASSGVRVLEMGRNAAERAKEFSWDRYRLRLNEILNSINI